MEPTPIMVAGEETREEREGELRLPLSPLSFVLQYSEGDVARGPWPVVVDWLRVPCGPNAPLVADAKCRPDLAMG